MEHIFGRGCGKSNVPLFSRSCTGCSTNVQSVEEWGGQNGLVSLIEFAFLADLQRFRMVSEYIDGTRRGRMTDGDPLHHRTCGCEGPPNLYIRWWRRTAVPKCRVHSCGAKICGFLGVTKVIQRRSHLERVYKCMTLPEFMSNSMGLVIWKNLTR